MAPLAPLTTKPLKPDNAPVLLMVRLLFEVPPGPIVNVPLPDKVPFKVIAFELAPLPVVGSAPSGKLQLLLTVFVPLV